VTVAVSKPVTAPLREPPLLSARDQLDVITAYREVGTYRGAAQMCGVDHKTVKRVLEQHSGQGAVVSRSSAPANYEIVRELVAAKIAKTHARITAKRLLGEVVAAGYAGSERNLRRLVAQEKQAWRRARAGERQRRPAVWSPGEYLVIDWGVLDGVKVFCAVLAFSRVRFVRFADNERAETTLGMLAECFETLGGVPKVVLADRMGCLKAGVVADVVIPTPDYVRFATHYRFRPDFCHGYDPASKGIVENLVGYAKTDLMVPLQASHGGLDLAAANAAAVPWCAEVNNSRHSEIAAVPAQRFAESEAVLLGALPSLRPSIGRRETRKVDKLSTIRFASARYSVPKQLVGTQVCVEVGAGRLTVIVAATAEIVAEHPLLAAGEASILDEHYGGPRPNAPARKVRPRTPAEQAFCSLGPVAQEWLKGAAAAGNTRLSVELAELAGLEAAHGREQLVAALRRAVAFGRWWAGDVRSILAAGTGLAHPAPPGQALVITLPVTASRSLQDYGLDTFTRSTTDAASGAVS
jgi:transposase